MNVTDRALSIIRRLSPFSISLLLHALALILFSYITWYVPHQAQQEAPAATLVLHGQKEDHLKFQDKDFLDRFKVEEHMVYPLPEIEYSPVLPDVKFYPEPRIREELNLIGVEVLNRKWLSPSTGRQPLYTGEEKLAGSFTRHIQVLREGGLDIVFVFDSTSSMAEFLRQVTTKIVHMIDTFKKLVPTARIGLVTYRDTGDEFITRAHPLTYGTQSLQDFLKDIDPVGGGDWEEAVDEALRVAVEDFNWREKSKKIILLIGDAPPHDKDMHKAIKLIDTFKKDFHGVVSTLDTSRPAFKPAAYEPAADDTQQVTLRAFKLFAEKGGGESARLIDEERVIRQMVVLVFGTRWEVCLDEFMKNL